MCKLPRDEGESSWLHVDFKQFPAPFLLFSAHVGNLALEDRETGALREIIVRTDGAECRLSEDDTTSKWTVFGVLSIRCRGWLRPMRESWLAVTWCRSSGRFPETALAGVGVLGVLSD